jgi:hypothetical protein
MESGSPAKLKDRIPALRETYPLPSGNSALGSGRRRNDNHGVTAGIAAIACGPGATRGPRCAGFPRASLCPSATLRPSVAGRPRRSRRAWRAGGTWDRSSRRRWGRHGRWFAAGAQRQRHQYCGERD